MNCRTFLLVLCEPIRAKGAGSKLEVAPPRGNDADPIQGLLARLRRHVDLDVCFVGEIVDGKRIFRFVEGAAEAFGIDVGDADPSDQSFCQRMLEGAIPSLIHDARNDPATCGLPGTEHRGIGSYIGVPIVLPSGRIYGTLCAIGHDPRHDLDQRDVSFVEFIADLIGEELAARLGPERFDPRGFAARIDDEQHLAIVFQPVVELRTGRTVGFEALSRFPNLGPEAMFAEAWRQGRGQALELKAISMALASMDRLPSDAWLSVNVAPQTILSRAFFDLLEGVPASRLVVEITEHDAVANYAEVSDALEGVLDRGVRLAIDDVGSGYASLSHIVELSPDILKLDGVFTRGVESEIARRALANAFVRFARDIDAMLVVECIETPQELRTLQALGIGYGQGFHLGRPAALDLVA